MQECARRLFIMAPTDLRALVDLLMYLERTFPPCRRRSRTGFKRAVNRISLLHTMRLSQRAVAKYGKHGPG